MSTQTAPYLTMPNPKLTMMTSILASVLFKVDTNSAKTTAPRTEIEKSPMEIKVYVHNMCREL